MIKDKVVSGTLLLLAGLISLFLMVSCSNPDKDIQVKPSGNSTPQTPAAPEPHKQATAENSEIGKAAAPMPDRQIMIDSWIAESHIAHINMAIGAYYDIYNKMPLKVDDLLNGWIPLWPRNIYTDEPVKILDHKPDPANKADFGNFYFERIDDQTAKIHLVALDQQNSIKDNVVYMAQAHEVISDRLRMKYKSDSPRFAELKDRLNQPEEQRFQHYYVDTYLKNLLESLFSIGYMRLGTVDYSLDVILKADYYYVLPEGWDNIKKLISNNVVYFDAGISNDKIHPYFSFGKSKDLAETRCWNLLQELGLMGTVEKNITCPEPGPEVKQILSSDKISNVKLPDELIIKRDTIR